ncbi:MAG: molecular chaperone DnaJ [Nitrospinota bacterium]
MKAADPYAVLGVPRDANPTELRAAYRRLALDHHPDRNPGDPKAEARFKEIVLAYEVLRDPLRRSAWDAGRRGGPGDFGEQWEEIFAQLFRRARHPEGPGKETTPARDIQLRMEVTLEEGAGGIVKEFAASRWVRCEVCRGKGEDPKAQALPCPLCKGSGELKYKRGLAGFSIPCSVCEGRGESVRERCPSCGGAGRKRREERLRVQIPPAAEDGARLKLRGKGDEGAERGEAGDLIVTVAVRPHPLFQREGLDLLFDLPVSFPQAALGDEVAVPTLDGEVRVRIPAGTQSGRVFRLRGKGLCPPGSIRPGDQRVRVVVETPTRLNERQKKLLEEFQRLSSPSTNPRMRKFWEKVKGFLG